jgi:hypothetical protein
VLGQARQPGLVDGPKFQSVVRSKRLVSRNEPVECRKCPCFDWLSSRPGVSVFGRPTSLYMVLALFDAYPAQGRQTQPPAARRKPPLGT